MVEDIADTPVEELMTIRVLQDIAAEPSRRAIEFIEVEARQIAEELASSVWLNLVEIRIADTLCRSLRLPRQASRHLIADLDVMSCWNIRRWAQSAVRMSEIIMEARAHWFDDEPETDTADEMPLLRKG